MYASNTRHSSAHGADQVGEEANRIVVTLIQRQPCDGVCRRSASIPLGEQCRLAGADRRGQQHELVPEHGVEAREQRSTLDARSSAQRRFQLGVDEVLRADRTRARRAGQLLLRFYGAVGGAFAGERIVHSRTRVSCKPYNTRAIAHGTRSIPLKALAPPPIGGAGRLCPRQPATSSGVVERREMHGPIHRCTPPRSGAYRIVADRQINPTATAAAGETS